MTWDLCIQYCVGPAAICYNALHVLQNQSEPCAPGELHFSFHLFANGFLAYLQQLHDM